MARTTLQKLHTLAQRVDSGGVDNSGYHRPQVDIRDYVHRAALGSTVDDFVRTMDTIRALVEAGEFPVEVAEMAQEIRYHSGRKDIE